VSSIRWIVRPGDGETVGVIAKKAAPRDPAALAEGRVFIGKKRAASAGEAVRVGDLVDVFRPRRTPGSLPLSSLAGAAHAPLVRVLHHDAALGFVVVEKPAAMATVPDHHGAKGTLVDEVGKLLSLSPSELRIVSRLDVGVSGAVVIALDEAGERRLAAARQEGTYRRGYLAIGAGLLDPPQGVIDAAIGRHADPRKRAVDGPEAKAAVSAYEVVGVASGHSLLRLSPKTGRTHQLRVHLASRGAPLLGDRAYGGALRLMKAGKVMVLDRIALHAHFVEIKGVCPRIEAPVPAFFSSAWAMLEGAPAVWTSVAS
jgi:23S rRNA-/tRNA-specific pseudouridylate synthase